jgi:hypothetical protein
MKNRIRKKQLCESRKREAANLPKKFVRDTLRALAEAQKGELTAYEFGRLVGAAPSFARQMALAENIMHDDREMLRVLAK